jgi:hypothetical protein
MYIGKETDAAFLILSIIKHSYRQSIEEKQTILIICFVKGQGHIRNQFGLQGISSQFNRDHMQKNVAIHLVINFSRIVMTGSHFVGNCLQKKHSAHTCLVLEQSV